MQGLDDVTDGLAAPEGEALIVDVEGYEGPLDVLLALARVQKVDLRRISILALAEQYLGLHRGGAYPSARPGGRLSGDGIVACLSEVAAAAAAG